jgi:carboxyl-terminal processing protease
MSALGIRSTLAALWMAMAVAGCGGGGGYGGSGSTTGPPADPIWTAGSYLAPANLAAYCAQPRTGTDPNNNGAPYPDRQGSVDWENSWIRAWTHAYYLWYRDAPDLDPATYSTTADYFAADKTPKLTASGTPVDRFHFTYPTAVWEQLSQSGVSVGYGLTWSLVANQPPRQALVAYLDPTISAVNAATGILRGASVLTVDGVDLVNSSDVTTLNAGLFPVNAGETHTFTILDAGSQQQRTISLTSADVTDTPVIPDVTKNPPVILATATGKVGYALFNEHIATAEVALVNTINAMSAAGVTDLVLDIRYNGGGYLDIASELAYMIAGPGPTQAPGVWFDKETFNDQYPNTDPITGQPLTPTPFHSTAQGFSVATGQPLPTLNLARVFVLTGPDTCSASEAIMNSLRGVNVQVILVGSQTCGKPYGFYPQDNCGTTYFSIEFEGVNAQGFGAYADGFVAQNSNSTSGVPIPGCSVADDYAHALGDPAEARLAAALGYRASAGAACPSPPTGFGPPTSPLSVDGHVVRPEWLKNRIVSRPR